MHAVNMCKVRMNRHARGGGKIVIGKYRFKAVAGQKPPTAGPRRALKSATTRQISPVTSTGGEPRLNPSAHRSLRVDRVSCGWTQGVADRQVELVQRYQGVGSERSEVHEDKVWSHYEVWGH